MVQGNGCTKKLHATHISFSNYLFFFMMQTEVCNITGSNNRRKDLASVIKLEIIKKTTINSEQIA